MNYVGHPMVQMYRYSKSHFCQMSLKKVFFFVVFAEKHQVIREAVSSI